MELLRKEERFLNDDSEIIRIITEKNGTIYYTNERSFLHRLDGPAVTTTDGHLSWYKNGVSHCETGPAKLWKNGKKEYFINGKKITEEEFNISYGN